MAGPKPGGVTDFRPPEHQKPTASPTQVTGQPYVDPEAVPAVTRYVEGLAERTAQRRGALLPKYDTPVGGAPTPTIPRLDAAHASGRTMAEQAEDVNSNPLQQQLASSPAAQTPGSIVEAPVYPGMPGQQARPPSPGDVIKRLGIRPTDMLPEEAQRDPEFQRGNGAMFAVAQPGLVMRYGIVRNGERIMPQQLRDAVQDVQGPPQGPRSQLRPETVQGLRDLEEFQRKSKLSPEQETLLDGAAEEQVSKSAAGLSAQAGTPIAEPKELTQEEQEEAQRRVELMDSFDYDSLRQAINRDVINNPDQREIIEKRLEPLDIDELIVKNRVSQRVPIVPKRFEVTYTSMTGQDDLALKRLIMQESKSVEVTERYLLDKYAFMAITCGLTAINGNSLPSHFDEKDLFDEDRFWKKFEWVMQRPLHMLSSIGVNHTWFEMRVRKLFVAEKVGNT